MRLLYLLCHRVSGPLPVAMEAMPVEVHAALQSWKDAGLQKGQGLEVSLLVESSFQCMFNPSQQPETVVCISHVGLDACIFTFVHSSRNAHLCVATPSGGSVDVDMPWCTSLMHQVRQGSELVRVGSKALCCGLDAHLHRRRPLGVSALHGHQHVVMLWTRLLMRHRDPGGNLRDPGGNRQPREHGCTAWLRSVVRH